VIGIALHGGPLPGYAASHGCVRMPYDFAEKLFDKTRIGMRVIISPNGRAARSRGRARTAAAARAFSFGTNKARCENSTGPRRASLIAQIIRPMSRLGNARL